MRLDDEVGAACGRRGVSGNDASPYDHANALGLENVFDGVGVAPYHLFLDLRRRLASSSTPREA